ncbi:MAG: hypothetical protein IKB75_06895 [Clostridia bacterium]|nr:hypothetical protein [Clostridia bacterium]
MGFFANLFAKKAPKYAQMSKEELLALKDSKFYTAVIATKNTAYQGRFDELTDLQKTVFAVHEFDCCAFGDVTLFFTDANSAKLAPYLLNGLQAVGALKTKAQVEKLVADVDLNGSPVTLNPLAVKAFEEDYFTLDENLDKLLPPYVRAHFDEYYNF